MKKDFNGRPRDPMRDAGCGLLAVLAGALVLTGCGKAGGDADDHPAADKAADKTDKAEAPGVPLDAETIQHLGLSMAQPVATNWQAELTAYGTVLDPAPLTDALIELGRAEMTLDSSQKELDRAKVLKGQNNISDRAFQDAEATYRQNTAAATALYFKIRTAWGERIAGLTGPIVAPTGTERKPDPQLQALTEQSSLIRVDLPAGARAAATWGSVRIVSLADQAVPAAATVYDRLPVMDPQTQQQSLLCVVDRNAASPLIPGEAVTASITDGSANPVSGVAIPAGAVMRYQGAGWVYVQSATNRFVRVLIPLDRPTAGGWFVTEGLAATNTIIVTGAQTVLSTELSAGGFTTGERD